MAEFDTAYRKVILGYEGGLDYTLDPDDPGKETVAGISRKYHPKWEGWPLVDELKSLYGDQDELDAGIQSHGGLSDSVQEFYKENYWHKFWGGKIRSQPIADELFDVAVNLSVRRAVEFLQKGINALNRSGAQDLKVDGKFGPNTFNALQGQIRHEDIYFLVNTINILQGVHYLARAIKEPIARKYYRGWLTRVEIIKKP